MLLNYIHQAADSGLYDIRGLGAKRRLPTFDDLTFLTASASRYPLEGYREKCSTKTVLGARRAERPIVLETPVTVAGMSFGALSGRVKEAIGRAASAVGTSTTTGDGGMTQEERRSSKTLVYQCLPSRYGFQPRRPAVGRRHRDCSRTRRKAGRRRDVARTENQPARRADAHAA